MEERKINYENNDLESELIIPPVNIWDKDTENKHAESEFILQIKQKYRDSVLMEIHESGRILHAELANRIAVSASGLNAIIKKMNEYTQKTIRETKAGKFKIYTLTKESTKYIENVILPSMVDNKQDEEDVHNLFSLLSVYKDKNNGVWIKELTKLIEEEYVSQEVVEDADKTLGYELLHALEQFYQQKTNKAKKLLELGVADKETYQSLMLYFEDKCNKNNEAVWLTLNLWVQQDCRRVYHMLDDLFLSFDKEEQLLKNSEFQFQDGEKKLEAIINKIKADILQAILHQWPKNKLIDFWIIDGMELQLAMYLAEKYKNLAESFFKKIKTSCEILA